MYWGYMETDSGHLQACKTVQNWVTAQVDPSWVKTGLITGWLSIQKYGRNQVDTTAENEEETQIFIPGLLVWWDR